MRECFSLSVTSEPLFSLTNSFTLLLLGVEHLYVQCYLRKVKFNDTTRLYNETDTRAVPV